MTDPDPAPGDLEQARAQNALASSWMKRGIALLGENTHASLHNAVQCFDRAIELRNALPLEREALFRYGLAAGWMNRGDALTRLGSAESFVEAVRSYDEALKQISTLPFDENPLFRKRAAIAWLNRGITLQQQGKDLAEALRSFDEAIAVLENAVVPDANQILGCAWMNRGNTLLQWAKSDSPAAATSAKQALGFLLEMESTDPVAAEAGLKARHTLCRALANQLSALPAGDLSAAPLIADATDAADEGMQLARLWELCGDTRFRELAGELFCFGAHVYQMYQPQFLVEFLLESLDPKQSPGAHATAKMHREALRALWSELRNLQKPGFPNLNAEKHEESLQRLSELSAAENRLRELRRE